MSVNTKDYGGLSDTSGQAVPSGTQAVAAENAVEASITSPNGQGSGDEPAPVHAFARDASPQQKAAAAVKSASTVNAPVEGAHIGRTNVGHEVKTDIAATKITPTVTSLDQTSKSTAGDKDTKAIGTLKDGSAPQLESDAKVGWKQNDLQVSPTAQKEGQSPPKDVLAEFLSDIYYGTSWHNAGIIFFAVFSSHFVTVFGGGYGMLIFIMIVCATYYNTSIRRVRHRARDDIHRELSKQRLYSAHESADWINNFLRRFWIAYEPLLSATIVLSVDQVLSESCPSFLESLRLTTFTLGNKAPRIDLIKTYPDTDDETVVMDMKISFTPNDTADLTLAQASGKVNPKIVLNIRVGKGVASLGKDVIVEDITFTGHMRFKLKMMSNFPNIKTVEFCFMEKPIIDFVLKPIGFDLSIIPGLENFIHSQVHANLGPMMYDPNSFVLDLEQLLSGVPLDTAIGVVQVTVFNARGLKATKIGGGSPDPYVSLSISQRAEIARTRTKHSTASPKWNETKYILINSLQDVLAFTIMDWNDHRKDSELGLVSFSLKQLEEQLEHELVHSNIMSGGRDRGVLNYSVKYFPVLTPKKLSNGQVEPIPESNVGIVRLTVHQAKDLDLQKSLSHSQANPYARIYLQSQNVGSTRTLKRTTSPAWEQATEFMVTDKAAAVIGVKICDERGSQTDPVFGFTNVPLNLLLEAKATQHDWFPLSDCRSGRVRMSAEWKPILAPGAINGSRGYTAPIGIVKFWIKRGIDLKNVEGLTGGKSDPYMRAMVRGVVQARTEVVNNNLNPVWDEIIYCPVHSSKDTIVLEAMDYQHTSKDRSLGICVVQAFDLVAEGIDKINKPWAAKPKMVKTEPLQIDNKKSIKGSIMFEASFHPCFPMPNISFDPPPSQVDQEIAAANAESNDDDEDGNTIAGSSIHEKDTLDSDMRTDELRLQKEAAQHLREQAEKLKTQELAGATASASNGAPAISREQLLKTQTGVLAFNIVSGQIAKGHSRLEVLFDSGYWPAYSTEVSRSLHPTWDECGDSFIKELDYSRILFKLNQAEKETIDAVYAEATYDLNDFLEMALDKQCQITLTGPRGENKSIVTVCAKYIPVEYNLEARESVNNTGNVRLDIIGAKNLKSADRNGYSDPYAVIEVNGHKVFKTQTIKKTLNPTWNEHTDFAVQSRTAAQCLIKVYDWDVAGSADKLGQARIDLAALEPFTASSVAVELADAETGKKQGTVNLRLLFRPEFLNRQRAATSSFSHGVERSGSFIDPPLSGGALSNIRGAAGKGVSGAAYRITHRGHGRNASATQDFDAMSPSQSVNSPNGTNTIPPVPALPAGVDGYQTQNRAAISDTTSNAVNGHAGDASSLDGVLRLVVVGAHANDEKATVVFKAGGGKMLDKHHDAFSYKTSSEPCLITAQLIHKKTFGKDELLGTAEFDAWQYIRPAQGLTEAKAVIDCQPEGSCELELSWAPSAGSTASSRASISDSPSSMRTARRLGSRFSKNPKQGDAES